MQKITRAARLLAFAALALALGFSAANAQTARAKNKNVKPIKKTIQKTDDKIVYEPDAEMLADLRGKVLLLESKKDWAQFNRQQPINNADGTRTAYVAQFKMKENPEATTDVIVVFEKASDKFYEIRGIEDFPWRPFDQIKWTSNEVLEFEQWVNPNNGGRYAVNVKTGKIVRAGYVRSK